MGFKVTDKLLETHGGQKAANNLPRMKRACAVEFTPNFISLSVASSCTRRKENSIHYH